MKLKIISVALILILSGASSVSAEAVLTVNGSKVEKTVARIGFEGDNVKVTFGDDSTATYDMDEVSFSFVPEAGIGIIPSFKTIDVTVGDKLDISGLTEGSILRVYDLHGVLGAQAVASGETCEMDIAHLEGGAYILKVGKDIIKFIKR